MLRCKNPQNNFTNLPKLPHTYIPTSFQTSIKTTTVPLSLVDNRFHLIHRYAKSILINSELEQPDISKTLKKTNFKNKNSKHSR